MILIFFPYSNENEHLPLKNVFEQMAPDYISKNGWCDNFYVSCISKVLRLKLSIHMFWKAKC